MTDEEFASIVWNLVLDKLIARAQPIHIVHDGLTGLVFEHDKSDQLWDSLADWLEWQRHSGPDGVLCDRVAEELFHPKED